MTAKSKEIILRAMQNAKGDDLERARAAYSGLSEVEMQVQPGTSGKTRQQILDSYVAGREEWTRAMEELLEAVKI